MEEVLEDLIKEIDREINNSNNRLQNIQIQIDEQILRRERERGILAGLEFARDSIKEKE